MLPALLAGRADIRDALQHAGRQAATVARAPIRHALAGIQLALTTALVVGAALLLQSAWNMEGQALGFRAPESLLTANISRPQGPNFNLDRDVAFYEAVLREAAALPGVVSVALSSGVPLGLREHWDEHRHEGAGEGRARHRRAGVVANRVAELLQDARRAGAPWKHLRPRHRPRRHPSILISRTLAEKLWPNGEDPIGRSAYLGGGQHVTVAGIVGDVRLTSIVGEPVPAMYFPSWLMLWETMTVVVRAEGDPAALAGSLRAAVSRADRAQPIFDVETMEAIVGRRIAEPRLNATLLSIFAAIALMLAAVGVAGVMAYAVARRTGELAVRQALGASPRQAMAVVMSSGLKVSMAGIAAGLAGALALGQALSGLLYGVAARDLPTLSATCAALFAVAAIACWLPARRATRISPTLALREQ